MAERSHVGPGRMSEPAEIFAACADALAPRDLENVRVLVTAGPTREMLDPVRYLSNPSSGRMGYAIAEAARDRGARVTLISGPAELPRPADVEVVDVVSAEDLARAVDERLDGVRVVVMAAAVADQRPATRASRKVKKQPGDETMTLVRTLDILAGLGARAQRPMLVGFAAESENLEENARDKLARKKLDLIVANDVADAFGKETNRGLVLRKDGPRGEGEPGRLYRAAGVARWEEDGSLQHPGRRDREIKLRSVRIAPGDSDQALPRCPGSRRAVVIPRDRPAGGRALVAYLVTHGG